MVDDIGEEALHGGLECVEDGRERRVVYVYKKRKGMRGMNLQVNWSLRLRNVEGVVVGLVLATHPCSFAVFCITWDHFLFCNLPPSSYTTLLLSSYPSTLHPNSMTHDIGRIMQSFTHLYFNLIKTLHQLYMQKCSYVH